MKTQKEPTTITVRLFRFDPAVDHAPRYENYSVPHKKYMRIMDVLEHLTDVEGVNVAYRSSCGIKKCGTCGVLANGVPKLACYEAVEDGMTIAPLSNFPIIRDLVVDRSIYDKRVEGILPFMIRGDNEAEFPETIKHSQMVEKNRFDQCINCLICVAACPVVASTPSFLGPAAAVRVAALAEDFRDAAKEERLSLISDEFGLSRCHMIGECTAVCPAHVEPALAIQRLRRRSVALAVKRTFKVLTGGVRRPWAGKMLQHG